MYSEHETGVRSPSAVLASFKTKPNQTKQPQCLYVLSCELGALTKEQESWVHHFHHPEGIQNHIYYSTREYLESCPRK